MAGLDPAIHEYRASGETWMPGTSLDKPGHDAKVMRVNQLTCEGIR